jgi:hypothetical protein
MSTLGLISAFALAILGVAIAIDPSLRIWFLKPRRLKLTLEKTVSLIVGVPTKILTTGVNAAGITVPLHAIPTYTAVDPAITLAPAADGLSVEVTASLPGTYVIEGSSAEPTGTITGSVSGTFADAPPDLVPAKLVLTFVDA